MKVHVAQQHANRSTLRGSLLARMNHSIFQHARFQPAPDQADQARITDSMFDKPEDPIMIETPELVRKFGVNEVGVASEQQPLHLHCSLRPAA
jgi:hypothetical protein